MTGKNTGHLYWSHWKLVIV